MIYYQWDFLFFKSISKEILSMEQFKKEMDGFFLPSST